MSYTAPVTALAPFYGATAYFALAGDTVETVTVSASAKPAGSVFTAWKALSCIETAEVSSEVDGGESRFCFNATTGKWEEKETQGQVASLSFDLTVQEITEFILQMAYNVSTIDSDGAGVPNSNGEGLYRGYLKVQQQNGTEVVTVMEAWGELSLTNAMQIAGRSGSTPSLTFKVVDNANNEIQFGTDVA